jgi:hypothetical protein
MNGIRSAALRKLRKEKVKRGIREQRGKRCGRDGL